MLASALQCLQRWGKIVRRLRCHRVPAVRFPRGRRGSRKPPQALGAGWGRSANFIVLPSAASIALLRDRLHDMW